MVIIVKVQVMVITVSLPARASYRRRGQVRMEAWILGKNPFALISQALPYCTSESPGSTEALVC